VGNIVLSEEEWRLRAQILHLEQQSADLRQKAEWLLLDLQTNSIDTEAAISRMKAIIKQIKNIRRRMDAIKKQHSGAGDHSHDKASNRCR
jgi:uncharacterized protein YgbK (DUF1537 family)